MENDLGPKQGESATQFKTRIEETQRELKRQTAAAAKPSSDPAASAPAQVPPSSGNGKPSEPAKEPPKAVTGNPEVDEWWSKKGFKSSEDLAQSYRELEREFHRKQQEGQRQPAPQALPPPIPANQPNPAWNQQPPMGYYPQQAPVYQPQPVPTVNIEELASRYNLTPDDFKRVAAIANDMAETKLDERLRQVLPPIVNQVGSINREVSRNAELVNLMADPLFKNPQVQFEMHRVLEESPATFVMQTQPYRYAFDEALRRVARNQLGGSKPDGSTPASSDGSNPSFSRPPSTAGGNGAGGGATPAALRPEDVTADLFARMSYAEKQAHLRAVGARS